MKKVPLRAGGQMYVSGKLSSRGVRYVYVELGAGRGLVPWRLLASEQETRDRLANQNVLLGPFWREFYAQAVMIQDFDSAPIADRFGWNGDVFILSSGEVLGPSGSEQAVTVIAGEPHRFATRGTLRGWLSQVAGPLSSQSLPMTLVMAAFASALVEPVERRENITVCLLGGEGSGKSWLLEKTASITGEEHVASFNTTIDALESVMAANTGQPILIDEMNLFYGDVPPQKRGAKQKLLAFRLADGTVKRRWAGPEPERYYFVGLTATNENPQRLMSGEHCAVARAAADRMLTLEIGADREFGTFDSVPSRYKNARAFADAIDAGTKRHSGHAFRAFVKGLVDELHTDRAGTIDRINSNVAHWCERAGVDVVNGSQARVGQAFGLFYAAGEEAKRYGVLPASWWCGHAVETVYRRVYIGPKPPTPIDEDLRALLRSPGAYDLDRQGRRRRMSDALFARTPAFQRRNRTGGYDVYVPPAQAALRLPRLQERIGTSRAGVRLVPGDRGHTTVKRQVRDGHPPDRVVVLELPAGFI